LFELKTSTFQKFVLVHFRKIIMLKISENSRSKTKMLFKIAFTSIDQNKISWEKYK